MSKTAIAYGRSATKDEVAARDPNIKWCQWCATETCRLAGGDHLVVCDRFTEKKDAAEMSAPAPKSLAPTETVREILGRMEAGYIPPHKRDEEITALYAKLLKRALIREGNPVALRKVLLDAKNRLETIARHDRDWRWSLERDIRGISAALATPPRNCDVVLIENLAKRNIADIVWAAFRETHPNAYLDVPGLLQCINWLFDKAKEVPHA